MEEAGLILEGGGLRGIFTSGILDYFMEKGIVFPYVIGVSMGALNAASYISKQKGRGFRIPYTYLNDPRYLSIKNIIKEGSYFGMDFIFNKVVYELDPFDFLEYENSSQKFICVAAHCKEGRAHYFDKSELSREDSLKALMATSSLPFISKMVRIGEEDYLDGGLIDSVPIEKALSDNVKKPVVILTRPYGYRKKTSGVFLSKLLYRKYPKVTEMIKNKANNYNRQVEFIEKLEKENKIFVIRPDKPIEMGRTEKNTEKLKNAYDFGYNTIRNREKELLDWLRSE